jgi:hypothetical protein
LYSESAESPKGTDIVLDSTEPANYRGSYTAVPKEIVDIEIAMYQSAAAAIITITGTITIESVTAVTATMELLLLLLFLLLPLLSPKIFRQITFSAYYDVVPVTKFLHAFQLLCPFYIRFLKQSALEQSRLPQT